MRGIRVFIRAGFDVMRTGPSAFIVIGGNRPSVKPERNVSSFDQARYRIIMSAPARCWCAI